MGHKRFLRRLLSPRSILRAVVLGIVAALGAAALSEAVIPSSDGTVHACRTTAASPSPNLQIYDVDKRANGCQGTDVSLDWNAEGIPGDKGAPGATGQQGAQGPAGPVGPTRRSFYTENSDSRRAPAGTALNSKWTTVSVRAKGTISVASNRVAYCSLYLKKSSTDLATRRQYLRGAIGRQTVTVSWTGRLPKAQKIYLTCGTTYIGLPPLGSPTAHVSDTKLLIMPVKLP